MVPRQPEAGWRSILLCSAMKHWEQRGRNEPKESEPVVGQNFAAEMETFAEGKTFWDAQGSWEERSQTQTCTLSSSDGQWNCSPELVRVTCDRCIESLKHNEFWEEAWWLAALAIAIVLFTPPIKMGSCFQILVPARFVLLHSFLKPMHTGMTLLRLMQLQFQFQAAIQSCKRWSDWHLEHQNGLNIWAQKQKSLTPEWEQSQCS